MARKFTPQAAPPRTRYASGGSGTAVCPNRLADEIVGREISGAWLTCYMIRRFGWPNIGSDDYKDLCAWCLTTPIDGLFLVVRPHLGSDGTRPIPAKPYSANIHFSLRCSKEVGAEIDRDPVRERHGKQRERDIRKWWQREGSQLYVVGNGDPGEDELVREWCEVDGVTYGVWRRPEGFKPQLLPKDVDPMVIWSLLEFVRVVHPGALPERTIGERRPTAFQRRAIAALKVVLRDLMRPTYVRDLGFVITGIGAGKGSMAEPWEGAGNSAEYWYSARRKRHQRKQEVSDGTE